MPSRINGHSWAMVAGFVAFAILAGHYIMSNVTNCDKDKNIRENAKSTIAELSNAVAMFSIDHNRYPEKLEDLVVKPGYVNQGKWPRAGYIGCIRKDGWGRGYIYNVHVGKEKGYEIASYGKDGKIGGSGPNEDIVERHD